MAAAMLNLSGRKFVVIPEKEYRKLKAEAARNGKAQRTRGKLSKQERGDIAEASRRLANPRWISHEQLKAELGL